MKNILKLLAIVLFVSFSMTSESQVVHRKKAKKEMVKQLHLTKQQKKQVKTFHKSTKEKKDIIKNNPSLTEPQKKEQLAQLKNEKHTKLEAILTPEQKTQFEQLRKEHGPRGDFKNKMKDGDWKQKRKVEDGKEKIKIKS